MIATVLIIYQSLSRERRSKVLTLRLNVSGLTRSSVNRVSSLVETTSETSPAPFLVMVSQVFQVAEVEPPMSFHKEIHVPFSSYYTSLSMSASHEALAALPAAMVDVHV